MNQNATTPSGSGVCIAAVYWITSSAVASNVSGTVRPSALAVLRLMTSSNLLACTTGRSAGFSPLRMLTVRAQQAKIPVIGYLANGDQLTANVSEAFRRCLNEAGYVEGRNLAIELRAT